jgi:putative transposase
MSDSTPTPELSAIPESQWEEARRALPIMKRLAMTPNRTQAHVIAAAAELGYQRTQLYELFSRFLADPA